MYPNSASASKGCSWTKASSLPTFAKWHGETPDGFLFSLKARRFATNRRVLAGAGDSIARFVDSGIAELKDLQRLCVGHL